MVTGGFSISDQKNLDDLKPIINVVEGHLGPECGDMLHGIGAAIVCLQCQQLEVEGYQLVQA